MTKEQNTAELELLRKGGVHLQEKDLPSEDKLVEIRAGQLLRWTVSEIMVEA